MRNPDSSPSCVNAASIYRYECSTYGGIAQSDHILTLGVDRDKLNMVFSFGVCGSIGSRNSVFKLIIFLICSDNVPQQVLLLVC
jgi:hypothetical protein